MPIRAGSVGRELCGPRSAKIGNRIGQVLVPFLASLIAVATGTAGILLVIAFTLAACGTAARVSWRQG